jgi:hypothetical protein
MSKNSPFNYNSITSTGGGGGTPGGSNTQVQFNDAGAFGGNAGFTYNKTTGVVSITLNGASPLTLANAILKATNTVNNYTQLAIQNTSNGTIASSDFIATADTGTDTTKYIDVGINSSGFTSASWTINGPEDGYFYTSDGALVIGTAAAKALTLFTGGTLAANARLTISSTGVINISNLTASSAVVTDASKNLTSLGYSTATTASTLAQRDANANLNANTIFKGFTSVAASGSLITLTAASTPIYLITGSGGQIIKLPDATTLPNGAIFSFNNNQSSGAITVNNNSNTLVASIPSGGYVTIVLNDNSIAAGSWDRHDQTPSNVSWSTNTLDYPGSITSATWNGNAVAINRGGTGATTAATALSNLGGQTATITNNGQSGTVTATATNGIVVYEFTGAGSLVLPTAVGNTAIFMVKNNYTLNITVTFTGGQNADGSTSISLIPYQALQFISNNTNYNIF